ARGVLWAVAGLSARDVWAVGQASGQPYIEHWDGRRWAVVPNAGSGTNAALLSVAPVSVKDVWTVGSPGSGSSQLSSITEHWDGRRWRREPGPVGAVTVAAVGSDNAWV